MYVALGKFTRITAHLLILLIVTSCGRGDRWSKEWEERFESFQPSEKIMDIIGVGPGMMVGEIGAGNGRFAVRVAVRVGPSGKVFANDIDTKAVRFMKRRCKREQIENMIVICSRPVETGFPDGELDLVYIINTYEEFTDPVTLLRNTRESLKPEGRLAVIAFDPKRLRDHGGHAVSRQVVIDQCSRAGFRLVHLDTTLTYDNIYIFE